MKRGLSFILIALLMAGCAATFAQRREISRPLVNLAVSHLQNGDPQSALVELMRAEKENPRDPEVHYHLAIAYRLLGRMDEALQHADKAAVYGGRLWDKHPGLKSEALNLKGVVLFDLGRNEEALRAFGRALEADDYQTPERTLYNMGKVYVVLEDYDQACKVHREALNRNSHYAPSWYELSRISTLKGDYGAAIDELNHALLEFPDYVEAHWELAQLYLKTGNSPLAIEHLHEVIRIDPQGLLGVMARERLEALGGK